MQYHSNIANIYTKQGAAMAKVFIDGSAGTTWLRIHERLAFRKELELITLSEELRKDPEARKDAINSVNCPKLYGQHKKNPYGKKY